MTNGSIYSTKNGRYKCSGRKCSSLYDVPTNCSFHPQCSASFRTSSRRSLRMRSRRRLLTVRFRSRLLMTTLRKKLSSCTSRTMSKGNSAEIIPNKHFLHKIFPRLMIPENTAIPLHYHQIRLYCLSVSGWRST